MSTRWSPETVVAEFPDVRANTMAIDRSGRLALLAGHSLAIVDLNRPTTSIQRFPRQSKYEITRAEWNPTTVQANVFALGINQKTEIFTCREGEIYLLNTLRAHTRVIADMNWSPFDPNCLATCSIDTFVYLWDIRDQRKHVLSFRAAAGASQVKWNKGHKHVIATANECDIRLWDERNPTIPSKYVSAHLSRVHGLDWCHNSGKEAELASSSQDCSVKLWDTLGPALRPISVLATGAPVWRARYTPFGCGMITAVVPQLRRGENSLLMWNTNNVMSPVHAFSGHNDVILEFQWRSLCQEGTKYQLVTWSKDQSLRIWSIDKNIERLGGHVDSDSNEDEESVDSLEQMVVQGGKNAAQVSFTSSNEGDFFTQPSRVVSDIGQPATGPSSREDGISDIGQSESEKTDNQDSRESVTEIPSVTRPKASNSLYQEFKLLNRDIPNVIIEEMNATTREVVVLFTCGKNKVCIELKFPMNYPWNAAPEMQFSQETIASIETKEEMLKTFKSTCQQHVKNNLSCLEPCIRNMAITLENCAVSEQTDTSYYGSPYNDPILGSQNFGSYQDGNVPFPRTCGATFCGARFLVCFTRPPHMKGLRNGSEITPRSLGAISTYLGSTLTLSQIASSAPSYSYMYPPMSQSPNADINVSISSLYFLDRRHKFRGKMRKEDKPIKMASVTVYDITKLLTIKKELGELYVINARDFRNMCQKNIIAANLVGRKDLVWLWNLIALTANVALTPPSDDPDRGLPWSMHPFGRKFFEGLIRHYLSLGDIQTVAMLCCVLSCISPPTKKSPTIEHVPHQPVNKWWLKTGNSPYHTIHPGDTSMHDGHSIGAMLKTNRSNSWSESLDDYDSKYALTSGIVIRDMEHLKHLSNIKMFDPKLTIQYDEFKRNYAKILYQWNLLDARADVLKLVTHFTNQQRRIDIFVECYHCLEKVPGVKCLKCSNLSLHCSICRFAVKGAFSFCAICGHGGHVKHIIEWFLWEKMCPTGCGCACPTEGIISDN